MQDSFANSKAIAGLRLVGYGLLALSLFDAVDIAYPLQVFNSGWEFETVGNFVERVGFPLIGFGLVFLGEGANRSKIERFLLKPLSWMVLVVAIAYWLLVPIGVSAAWRIYNQSNAQVVAQLAQQREQAETARGQLDKLSDEQVKELVQRSTVQPLQNFNASEFRKRQRDSIDINKQRAEAQTQDALKQQSLRLLKKTVKWTLGAVIAGALLIYLWHFSAWARFKKSPSRPMVAAK